MPDTHLDTKHIGLPRSRIDGPAKVTGAATYAGEFTAPTLLHGAVVSSAIARGRITAIDDTAARALPGVVAVITHLNRPRTAWRNAPYRDEVAPPGTPLRALYDDAIHYSGQPIALVVAEDFDTARDAATLLHVKYAAEAPAFDLETERPRAYDPPKKRNGIKPPPAARGDADAALDGIPVRIEREYDCAAEHHNPMEPHATTVVWSKGSLLIHDKTQGVQNVQTYVQNVFGLNDVQVVSPYVGGGFGSGLRPQYQLYLAVLAATMLERSVRVALTRDQMFTFTHRPRTLQRVTLGATTDGTLQALKHEADATTSRYEDYQEVVVNWSGMLYDVEHATFAYRIAKLDIATPGDMRAPGAPTGHFAIESAMDELAEATGIDPVHLRLKNYAETDRNEGKPFSSKELRAALQRGADHFGWDRRTPAPRSMREGRELVGYGMAIGAWDSQMMQTTARARLDAGGRLEVATATSDIGTGTYTILAQVAAETMGVPMDRVDVRIGDSSLPKSPVEGGSWTAASAGNAVRQACVAVREQLFEHARRVRQSPFADVAIDRVVFQQGRIVLEAEPAKALAFVDIMAAAGVSTLEAEETSQPDKAVKKSTSSFTHSACFVEVRVDEQLGVTRVTRVVNAVAAGRILNPKTARSQVIGGVVFGIGMALHEESMEDHAIGRFMNHNLAEYHIPTNADVPHIDVLFMDEPDSLNPMGIKGLGEIGIVATPAAVANAVWHATGRRIRSLPITIDKLLADEALQR